MNSQQLKLLGILFMIIDHVGLFIFPDISIYRVIGRLSFPIYAFLLINTFNYTHNFDKKLMKLSIFAFITQIVFIICDIESLNIFVSMSISFILLKIISKNNIIGAIVSFILLFLFMYLGYFSTWYEIMFILILYDISKGTLFCKYESNILLILLILEFYEFNLFYTIATLFGLVICKQYNGKYGEKKYQNFFYAFYPLHLLFLMIVRTLIL